MQAEVEVTGLGQAGEGVGRHEGLVLFVPGAVPGDRCLVAWESGRRSMARARLLAVTRPSPDREDPPCPAFGRCGGCQLQAIAYPAELREKRRTVEDALRRIGHLQAEVPPCIAAGAAYGYRAKVSWPIRQQGGGPRIGLFAAQSHDVVEEDSCAVLAPGLRALPAALRDGMRRLEISAWDGREGLVRHAVARRARSGEVLLTLVATARDARLAELAQELLSAVPELVGVALSLHPGDGNRVLGAPGELLAGRGEIEERLLGLRFAIGPTSFFQVHPDAAELLFGTVAAWAGRGEGRPALDLYTGVGVLALALADAGYDVTGVEYDREAVALARRNASRNGLRARFAVGDAQEAALPDRTGLVTLDPPRGGAPRLAQRLAAEGPAQVIYVSCDPATLARDAAHLVQGGYRLDRVQPFDLFPRTAHVETVAEFRR